MNKAKSTKYVLFGLILSTFFVIMSFTLVNYYETKMLRTLKKATSEIELSWLDISIDGTKVLVGGTAPDEANRFKAISIISSIIKSSTVIDEIDVRNDVVLPKLNYSFELLRDDNYITIVGFIPSQVEADELLSNLNDISEEILINNLLEVVDYPTQVGWKKTLNYAVESLSLLPNSKISLIGNKIWIFALSENSKDEEKIKNKLISLNPGFFELNLNIESPRPLIQPFLFQLTRNGKGITLDNCSASDEYSKALIIGAVIGFGSEEESDCEIGIGAPSDDWAKVILVIIDHIKGFNNFSLTVKNKEVFIDVSGDAEDGEFQKIERELRKNLPKNFILEMSFQSLLESDLDNLNTFTATKSPEGLVQLRGYLSDTSTKIAVKSYARSIFGTKNVHDSIKLADSLLEDWSIQVLAGLEVIGLLNNGSLSIDSKSIKIVGQSVEPDIKTIATGILSNRLNKDILYKLDLEYNQSLIPKLEGVDPIKCVSDINNVIKTFGIEFAPGEIVLQVSSDKALKEMAEVMRSCYTVPMEIGGHTDSQGRKSLNLSISQARAEAVMDALLSYDILTGNLSAKGFGESAPIADNKTVEGRNKNRRIEFTLIKNDD